MSRFKMTISSLSDADIFEYNLDVNKGPISITCMKDAVTNVCYNCLDRHVNNGLADAVAFYWLVIIGC